MLFPKTTTAREIQRHYRKIFDQVKRTKEPVVVMRNNKPEVVVMDYKRFEEQEAINSVMRSKTEITSGKAKSLKKSLIDLWHEAQKS